MREFLFTSLAKPFWESVRPCSSQQEREQGFTLIELLVVLAILGLLVGFVAPAMIRQLGSAKHKVAEQSIERLSGILDLYRLDVGNYPTDRKSVV